MTNSQKENAPLRQNAEVETPEFDRDQVLRSCIALFVPLIWCIEFLARCQTKKKHTYSNDSKVLKTQKQTPSFDRVYGARNQILELCCAHPQLEKLFLRKTQLRFYFFKTVYNPNSSSISFPIIETIQA